MRFVISTVVAAFFMSSAHAFSPGEVHLTRVVCTADGIAAVVQGARLSLESVTDAITEQGEVGGCIVVMQSLPIMLLKRDVVFVDYDGDAMQVWSVGPSSGTPMAEPYFTWTAADQPI